MRGLMAIIAVSLVAFSCSQEKTATGIDERIARVESSLVEFTTPLTALRGDSADPPGL